MWGCMILFVLSLLSSCDEYNTDVVGKTFSPYNSLVSQYVHHVYVEYKEGDVRIWGPNRDLVKYTGDSRLTITSEDDSLALFVYGDAVGDDSLHRYHGQLKIEMDRDFALYLNGLRLRSISGPAIDVQAKGHICYLVVCNKSTNYLSDSVYQSPSEAGRLDGCLNVNGLLYMDGMGGLDIHSFAHPRFDETLRDSIYSHAIFARDGMICNYKMSGKLRSDYGDAIYTSGSEVKLLKGSWYFYTGRDTICTEDAEITIGEDAQIYLDDSLWVRKDSLPDISTLL